MQRSIHLLLAFLLSLSIGMGTTAHAMEPIASIDASEAGYFGHWAGDADEVPADADKGYPHHHGGCHDHGVGVPVAAQQIVAKEPVSQRQRRPGDNVLASADRGSLRRPPKA